MDGDGTTQGRATATPVRGGGGPAADGGSSLLQEAQRRAGRLEVRRAGRAALPGVLCAEDGPPVAGTGKVFPAAAGRVLRGNRLRARHRLAVCRLAEPAVVRGLRYRRTLHRSLDDQPDTALDRSGDPSGGLPVGAEGAGRL